MEKVEVKTIWSEMVKPLNPTPCHLKISKLSLRDQTFPSIHSPITLFYSAPQSSLLELLIMLKASLSKILSQFYPLAGRLLDDSTIDCNDEGALLIHTQVACSLKSYLSLSRNMFFPDHRGPFVKLFPSKDLLHGSHQHQPIPISAWVHLAFQVNAFECGGIAIGCYMNHKLMDGTAKSIFLQNWGMLCRGLGPEYLFEPNFDVGPTAFPPYEPGRLPVADSEGAIEQAPKPPQATRNSMVKAFVFKPAAINTLREMSASNRIPNPTRVESVVGFLWKHCLESEVEGASQSGGRSVRPTSLILTVNMRSRGRPPFPRESMGNMSSNVVARLEKNRFELVDMVAEIRGAISDFNDHILISKFQGDKGGEALLQHVHMIDAEGSKPTSYMVSSQCRLGHTDVDFGFGKPVWISLVHGMLFPMFINVIFMMDHIDPTTHPDQVSGNNGILAWVALDKKQMQNLETNPDFLAFASPHDPSSIIQ